MSIKVYSCRMVNIYTYTMKWLISYDILSLSSCRCYMDFIILSIYKGYLIEASFLVRKQIKHECLGNGYFHTSLQSLELESQST